MTRNFMKAGAAAMAGIMLLAGCGGSGSDAKSSAGKNVEISFIHWGGDGTYTGAYKDRIEAFEKENPEIKVKVTTIADKYETKLQTMIAGKQAPDVMQVAENGMGFASKGAFIDLTDKVKDAGIDTEKKWGDITAQYTYDGELFGLPDRGGCTVAYYNKDLFDAAGVPYPTDDWTLDDYYSAVEKLTKDTDGDGKIDQWGTTSSHYQAIWGYMLQANGGNIIKDDKVVINSPENLETLTRYNKAYQDGQVVSYEELEKTSSGGDAYFAQGKIGINMTGLWGVQGNAAESGLNFDIAPVPKGAQDAGWPMGSALAISSQSSKEKQEAAWKFIQYMTDEDAQQMLGKGLPDCPADLQVLASDEFLNQQINGKTLNMKAVSTSMERVTIDGILRGPYYQEAIDECRNQIQEMLLGRLTPEKCLETLDKNLTGVVEQY